MGKAKWLNCPLNDVRARLTALGHGVSGPVISRLLKAAGYRWRLNIKEHEGTPHPDREQRQVHQQAGQPTISIDTKKKEWVGTFKNAGRLWCQEAEVVNIHAFPSEGVGRAIPYGIYDLPHHQGTVYVGQSADTPTLPLIICGTGVRPNYPSAFLGRPPVP